MAHETPAPARKRRRRQPSKMPCMCRDASLDLIIRRDGDCAQTIIDRQGKYVTIRHPPDSPEMLLIASKSGDMVFKYVPANALCPRAGMSTADLLAAALEMELVR